MTTDGELPLLAVGVVLWPPDSEVSDAGDQQGGDHAARDQLGPARAQLAKPGAAGPLDLAGLRLRARRTGHRASGRVVRGGRGARGEVPRHPRGRMPPRASHSGIRVKSWLALVGVSAVARACTWPVDPRPGPRIGNLGCARMVVSSGLSAPPLVRLGGSRQHPLFGVAVARHLIPLLVCLGVGLADGVVREPVIAGQLVHLGSDAPDGTRVEGIKSLRIGHPPSTSYRRPQERNPHVLLH